MPSLPFSRAPSYVRDDSVIYQRSTSQFDDDFDHKMMFEALN